MSDKQLTVEEMALAERKFLHDVSNQLVIAQGMGSFLRKALDQNPSVGDKEKERIQKLEKAVKELVTLVKDRRALLHSLNDE